jgi:hypothetical protein
MPWRTCMPLRNIGPIWPAFTPVEPWRPRCRGRSENENLLSGRAEGFGLSGLAFSILDKPILNTPETVNESNDIGSPMSCCLDDMKNSHKGSSDGILPSSAEEGMRWPQAMAGVVRPAWIPTTPRRLAPAPPLLIQGGEFSLALMSLCIEFHLEN